MKAAFRKSCASTVLLLAVPAAVLSSTYVSAFVLTGLGQTRARACNMVRCVENIAQSTCRFDFDPVPTAGRGHALWKRLDTLGSSGLAGHDGSIKESNRVERSHTLRPLLSSAISPGIASHTGLLLVSTLIVNIVKAVFFTKPPTEEEELLASSGDEPPKHGGMMDRCPWPFIFFHDPKQGMKDSPTWVVVCWYCLYRVWKYRSAVAVV
mmetsp:Transcript_19593/g.46331  ORF Transcript_19593/g.46331 Transcript_19593/m.46331 type:complete len:209 (-) Transcript_19593:180-806(-)